MSAKAVGRTVEAGPGFRQGLWQNFGVRDGFTIAHALCILEDSEGALWFGTHGGGICRFDGAEFTTFTEVDGLAGDAVHALVGDQHGHLWVGTHNSGVSRFDGTRFTNLTKEDGLASNEVYAILEDRSGDLWFGTHGGGVCRYDGKGFETFTTEDGLASNIVGCIIEDDGGKLWFGSGWYPIEGNGVSRYDGERFESFSTDDGLAGNTVVSLGKDRSGNVWFGTVKDGVSCYDGRFTTFQPGEHIGNAMVYAIMEDANGNMWFGTTGDGLTRYDGSRFRTFRTEDELASNYVGYLFEDSHGSIWCGLREGVGRFDGAQLTYFTNRDGLPHSHVTAILEDDTGKLWIGTREGVSTYDGVEFTQIPELSQKTISAVTRDRKENLWFGTIDGEIICRDRNGVQSIRLPEGVVEGIVEDLNGNMWFGTRAMSGHTEQGVWTYDGKQLTTFPLADDSVQCILQDSKGNLWFGASGLTRFDGTTLRSWTADDGLAAGSVTSLLEDRKGHLWCGTGRGLSRYDGEDFVTFTTDDGLPHNSIRSIMEDQEGHLWFGTNAGVSRYDGLVFQTLSRRDGLVYDMVWQIHQDRDGHVWMAADGGLTRYRPLGGVPSVRITAVVGDRRHDAAEEIRLSGSQKLVTLEFRGASLTTGPGGMAHVYRMRGRDAEWAVSYVRRVEYEDLTEGEYTFEVKAVDRDLNYSEPASVRIVVEPDPYLRAVAEALSAGGPAGEFIGESTALRQVQYQLAEVARTDVTVLISGETGTGKGLAARCIHNLSERMDKSFIQVNCGAIPEGLVESELFGHEKGAFTGAHVRKLGKVELAENGTLFLDEIGDLAAEAQVKLLRLLEERTFERVGGAETLNARVRVIAATNRNLEQMVKEGSFREDLYYRLRVFLVHLPALRERRSDIPLLAVYMEKMATHLHKPVTRLDPAAIKLCQSYQWPGNVRELEHALSRAVITCSGGTIRTEDLLLGNTSAPAIQEDLPTLEELECRYIVEVLDRTDWRVSGTQGAASILGLHEATLRGRMKKLGIVRSSS